MARGKKSRGKGKGSRKKKKNTGEEGPGGPAAEAPVAAGPAPNCTGTITTAGAGNARLLELDAQVCVRVCV